jgi:uncharacterized protein
MSDRTKIRRIPRNAVTDREVMLNAIDAGKVGHIAVVSEGQPYILPVGYARRGNDIIIHGSTGSRLFRALADGEPTCFTVTHFDGIVAARSAFHSSMHYRSVMILGVARRLSGDDELDALRVLTNHLIPERWTDARHPNSKERAKTMTLALPMDEWSLKVGDGPPEDEPEDYHDQPYSHVWAGVIPLRTVVDEPIPDDQTRDLGIPLPSYLTSISGQ